MQTAFSIEVLVATMQQSDHGLYDRMQLQTDAIFSNQCDRNQITHELIRGSRLTMVSTDTRGVGINRNIGLLHAKAELLMFADDDMVFEPGYGAGVNQAFMDLPDADIIIFETDEISTDRQDKRKILSKGRVRLFNFMRYGTYRVSCKRSSLLKANLWFSLLYGGGARYSCGEDSLFLREALRKGLKIYKHPFRIAKVFHQESTWFRGYNDKFFYDKGVWTANAFPRIKLVICLYFALKYSKMTQDYTALQILRLIVEGIRGFKKLEESKSCI
jgi:glycosyltransferase involved in cell wall biosynthesis